jgi:hypothetical protein
MISAVLAKEPADTRHNDIKERGREDYRVNLNSSKSVYYSADLQAHLHDSFAFVAMKRAA